MLEFKSKSSSYGFSYVLDEIIGAGKTEIVKIPRVSPNKRGINDIGWQAERDDVKLYGTLCQNPNKANTLWQEILPRDEINKTVFAIKIVNPGAACRVVIRAILN